MSIYKKTYKNGLRLILEKNNKNVIGANILVGVGSQNESESEEGFSHFIEHMAFKSSEKFSTEEIMDELTMLGADFNAYTSRSMTRFIFKCLAENFEKCFEIYSDMVLHPKYLPEEMDRERNVVIEEMKKYEDDPVDVMSEAVYKSYYDGTTLAHNILGNEKLISSVTREELFAYRNKFYRAENMIISVSGNIKFEELDRIVTKYFATNFDYESKPNTTKPAVIKPKIKEVYKIIERDDAQANVSLHIKGVTRSSKKKYVQSLFASILGNSQNSRLYKKIREELGLVYTIYAYSEVYPSHGDIHIVFGTRPQNVKKAISEIKKIIADFAEKGVTEEELKCAVNLKKSIIEFASETNSDLAEANGSMLYSDGRYINLKSRKIEYEKITAQDMNDFAKQIASEKTFNIVAVILFPHESRSIIF